MEYYFIGTIVNTHGIKGELKVKSETDFDRFKIGNTLYIGDKKEMKIIKSHRLHKGFDLVKFEGYDNINDVLAYKGLKIYINEESLEELQDDEYYFHELIGKKVYNQDKKFIGIVENIITLPQGEMLDIKRETMKNALIPFINEFVVEVKESEIIISEIEGLL